MKFHHPIAPSYPRQVLGSLQLCGRGPCRSSDMMCCLLQEATEQLQGLGGPEAARSLAARFPQVGQPDKLA